MNTLLDTPFWKHCVADTDLTGIGEMLEFYGENGPTGLCRYRMPTSQSDFGIEGYLTMLIGDQVAYSKRHPATVRERAIWDSHRREQVAQAKAGLDVREALAYVRHPGWEWFAEKANPG